MIFRRNRGPTFKKKKLFSYQADAGGCAFTFLRDIGIIKEPRIAVEGPKPSFSVLETL
jgi:hypothetical protein